MVKINDIYLDNTLADKYKGSKLPIGEILKNERIFKVTHVGIHTIGYQVFTKKGSNIGGIGKGAFLRDFSPLREELMQLILNNEGL